MKKIVFWFVVVSSLIVVMCPKVGANGFRLLEVQGVAAAAQTDAFCAQADDPSAIAHNPAGLTQLKGTQILQGVLFGKGYTTHTSPAEEKENWKSRWAVVPHMFFTSDLADKNWAAGIGITAPFGQSSEWDKDSFARYVSTFTELIPFHFNPAVAYQLTPKLSIGAGLSYYYSTATMANQVDWGSFLGFPGEFDGSSRVEGNGDGWGYNLGLLYKINPRGTIGFTFRSPITIDLDGEIELKDIPLAVGLGTTEIKSDCHTSLNLPAMLSLGYAFRPNSKWKLELDLDWTGWESLDYVNIKVDDPLLGDISTPYNYNNTFAYKFGLEHYWTDKLTFRGGYTYNGQAVPEDTFSPSLPESYQHHIGIGLGYKVSEKIILDLAYVYGLSKDRQIDNEVGEPLGGSIDGEYENHTGSLAIGLRYKF